MKRLIIKGCKLNTRKKEKRCFKRQKRKKVVNFKKKIWRKAYRPYLGTEVSAPIIKKNTTLLFETSKKKNTKRTDVSHIFDNWHIPKNCDKKVTKFCREKNLLVTKKNSPKIKDGYRFYN